MKALGRGTIMDLLGFFAVNSWTLWVAAAIQLWTLCGVAAVQLWSLWVYFRGTIMDLVGCCRGTSYGPLDSLR